MESEKMDSTNSQCSVLLKPLVFGEVFLPLGLKMLPPLPCLLCEGRSPHEPVCCEVVSTSSTSGTDSQMAGWSWMGEWRDHWGLPSITSSKIILLFLIESYIFFEGVTQGFRVQTNWSLHLSRPRKKQSEESGKELNLSEILRLVWFANYSNKHSFWTITFPYYTTISPLIFWV